MEFYCDVDWLNGLLCRIHWYGLYGWGFMNVVGLLDSSLMWCVNVCFDFDCMSAWSCIGDGMVCSRFLVGCWSGFFLFQCDCGDGDGCYSLSCYSAMCCVTRSLSLTMLVIGFCCVRWSSIFGHDYGSLHFECGWSLLLVGMGLLI